PRKELNGTEPDSSPSQLNGNHGISEHIASIPLNKEGKRYTMKQAFNVWFDHQDDIFADVSVALKPSENYKLPQPQPIYHLDFSHSRSADDESSVRDETDADNDPSLPADQEASFAAPKRHPGFPPNLSKSTSFGQETASVAPEPVLLQPEDISWVYLDPAGNEQGPFTGDIMQEWLTDGYLSLDLRIRRQEERRFQTLKDFCEAVQNFIQPFKVPLPRVVTESAQLPMPGAFQHQIADPPVSAESNGGFGGAGLFQNGGPSMAAPHQHQQLAFGSNLYSQLLPNGGLGAANIRTPSANPLFDFMGPSEYPLMNPQYSAGNQFGMDSMNPNLSFSQLHMPSLLQQQILSQQPLLSRSNSGWGMDNSMQNSLPSTPTATAAPVPLNIGQTQLGQSSLGQSGSMSPWINRVQTMSRVSSPFVPQSTLATDPADKVEDNLLLDMHSSMVSGILRDEDHNRGLASDLLADFSSNNVQLRLQPSADLTAKRESLAAPTKTEEASPKIDQAQVPLDAKPNSVIDETPVSSNEKPQSEQPQSSVKEEEKASQPAAAPWAKPKAKHDAPPLTLKQIQELEAERLQREKQLKAEMRQEIALASALAASKLEEKTPEKVTFNWAKSSQPLAAKKTLAEITERGRGGGRQIKSCKVSLASALASTPVKEDGGAWTTVTSKKPAAKKLAPTTSQSGISYSALSGAINPQVLRNASSGVVPTTSLNTQAIKEDFLVWARSAMTNLYPSVSKNDLLEVFTTLPLHGESAQLISETIYSSSATMDGRRFAQEFLKRRQQVEKQVGPSAPESWSSAIISSADKVPAVDDDGWSTSVKSKKKGRKN
ncbi:hypothetical protein HF325_004091, partial [Metschnikowia pulcherrima]